MNQYLNKSLRLMIMISVLALIILTTVAFAGEMKLLKRDQISPAVDSIVFGRIRYLNAIPKFEPREKEVRFRLWDLDARKKMNDFYFTVKRKDRLSPLPDGIKGYDMPFAAELESGEYVFGDCKLVIDDYFNLMDLPDLRRSNIPESAYINSLNAQILKSHVVPADSLVYLGVIEIKFTKIFRVGHQVDFETTVTITDDFDADIVAFQKTYPVIYERFKDNLVKATWNDYKDKDEAEKLKLENSKSNVTKQEPEF